MIIGVVITKIGLSGLPVDKELALMGPVLDPIKLHVDGIGYFLFYGVIFETLSIGVVYLNGCRRLWMTMFLKSGPNGNCFLAIDLGRSNFGIG